MRYYTVTFSAVSVSAAQDLFEITAGTGKPIEIAGIELGQSSDAGDSQDELLQISIVRGNSTSGSGGSSATPVAMVSGDAAASFTAEVNNTTAASSGAPATVHTGCWNVRAGYINWFPEGIRPTLTGSGFMVVRQTAPADAITMSGTLYVREFA